MKPITATIHRLIQKWNRKGFSPASINCGQCQTFALELFKHFPKGRALWGDEVLDLFENVDSSGHCFFLYEDLYYDSECPNGVTTPEFLPFYKRALASRNWSTIGSMTKSLDIHPNSW